jgi:predicted PurR-regulated permease PerM
MVKLEISYRAILLVAGIFLAIWVLFNLWPIVVIVATSFIFFAALLPYVEWMAAHRVPRLAAVVLIILAILAFFAGLAALVVPAGINEFRDLKDNLPEDARRLEEFLDDFGIEVELQERARNVDWNRIVSGESAVDYGQRALSVFFAVLTIFAMTAYLLADTPRMSRFLYQFVPPGREPEVERWLAALRKVVGGYIRGQVITSAAITVFTFVILVAVGVPNAIAFAVLAGFVDVIPIVGALIAVLLPTLAAFGESPTQAAIVLVALMAYQQFEDRVLAPRVYGATLNLPPVIVLIAVLAGGAMFGIAGVLLALPSAAVARVGLDYYLEKRQLASATTTAVGDELAAPDSA